MFRLLPCLLVLALSFTACDKKDEEEDTHPVWILYVTVRDGAFPSRPLPDCAHVKWRYSGEFDEHDTGCRNDNNFVKVWEKITEDVRIFYRVECPGYAPSAESFADFRYALVDTFSNRDGAEVIQNVTVTIYPE